MPTLSETLWNYLQPRPGSATDGLRNQLASLLTGWSSKTSTPGTPKHNANVWLEEAARNIDNTMGGPERNRLRAVGPHDPTLDAQDRESLNQKMLNFVLNLGPQATVWHGSPHNILPKPGGKYPEFDMSKIGTGEGAQAYGHGHYVAESQGVGGSYRDALTAGMNKYLIDGKPAGQQPIESQWLVENYVTALKRNGGNATAAIKELQSESARTLEKAKANLQEVQQNLGKTVDMGEDWGDLRNFTYTHDDLNSAIDSVNRSKEYAARTANLTPERIAENPGYLYKVDIPDGAIPRMLDWDKPLSQQAGIQIKPVSPSYNGQFGTGEYGGYAWHVGDTQVSRAYRTPEQAQKNAPLGSNLIRDLNAELGKPTGHQEILQSAGIPGIRYLDGGSRGAGQGTSNYVLFDDKLGRILEKNGVPTGQTPWTPEEWAAYLSGGGK